MNTVLVVEDEKNIWLGIASMVRRAPVPVAQVLECGNGEEALRLLHEHPADVVFTDLRMPRMDGIELVARLQRLENPPLVVVISGYDDFDYAVKMLRLGVRDYILKPVERQKVFEVLEKLEAELGRHARRRAGAQTAALQMARAAMLGTAPDEAALGALAAHYGSALLEAPYTVVCLLLGTLPGLLPPGVHSLGEMDGQLVLLAETTALPALKSRLLKDRAAGFSQGHQGFDTLSAAYGQAWAARKAACLRGMPFTYDTPAHTGKDPATDQLVTQVIHLLGTADAAAARRVLGEILLWAQNGRLSPDGFAATAEALVAGISGAYAVFPGQVEALAALGSPWRFEAAFAWYEALCQWMEGFAALFAGEQENQSRRKIHDAVAYLRGHYTEPIDMAVVSNQVSMN